ncbi:hypothetical protein DSCO28_33170 [Desulfosarcina ovata subsp. sediminis]|uniref:Uncharacterized protein n=1 Tax=Desulfosarcina ovata subsp. sediminis TaxID=885957 RepID=A0A5K7ZNH5_9BACT|nr:hypothetical protein DSCO28_33170 [Desulfosarcina ovata subsp. sediminis]
MLKKERDRIVRSGGSDLNWAIVELAAYTKQMSFRYSRLCGKASNAVDVVRSATPPGDQILGGNNDLSYYRP